MDKTLKALICKLNQLYSRKKLPTNNLSTLNKVNHILSTEDVISRPLDSYGLSGGLIYLNKSLKTILVPDLHARVYFIKNILNLRIKGKSVLELLYHKEIQIVCVGDGFHSETRGKARWKRAEEEYESGFKTHKYMDLEMLESLNLMEIIFTLKINFPSNFHYLKGNHENILNENTEGNRSFSKYVNEGDMVKTYIQTFFKKEFVQGLYQFEKKLPILAVGNDFLVSHCEPREFYEKQAVVNYYLNTDVIFDLTWTADGQAEDNSVQKMLDHYLPDQTNRSLYFGGHRPIQGKYHLRASGKYVQFHNPLKQIVVVLEPDTEINPDRDIYELQRDKG